MVDYQGMNSYLKSKGLDLDLIGDGLGYGIEEKIKPLLIVLNYHGFETTASCEGHSLEEQLGRIRRKPKIQGLSVSIVFEDNHSFRVYHDSDNLSYSTYHTEAPWVDIKVFPGSVSGSVSINDIIDGYNLISSIPWETESIGSISGKKYTRISPDHRHSLSELKGQIKVFAEYLDKVMN